MNDALAVDKRLVRRAFERAAASYDAAAVLQNEVCRRMLERLDYIRLEPVTILDAGSGTGNAVAIESLEIAHHGITPVVLSPPLTP